MIVTCGICAITESFEFAADWHEVEIVDEISCGGYCPDCWPEVETLRGKQFCDTEITHRLGHYCRKKTEARIHHGREPKNFNEDIDRPDDLRMDRYL